MMSRGPELCRIKLQPVDQTLALCGKHLALLGKERQVQQDVTTTAMFCCLVLLCAQAGSNP